MRTTRLKFGVTLAACALGLLSMVRWWPARGAEPETATGESPKQAAAPTFTKGMVPTAAHLIDFVNARARRVRTLRCDDAEFTIAEGWKSIPLPAALAFQRPGHIRLIGRMVGKVELDTGANDREIWLFMPKLKPDAMLRTTRAELERGAANWPLPLSPDWLVVVLGLAEHAPPESTSMVVRPESLELVSEIRSPQGGKNNLVTVFKRFTEPLQVTGYRLETRLGEVLSTAAIEQTLKDEAAGVDLPQRVRLTFPPQKLEVRLRLQRISVNNPLAGADPKLLFAPPESEPRDRAVDPLVGSPAAPRPAVPQELVVVLGDAKITIPPGAKTKITGVKTAQGGRVRLEVAGTVIEAPRLRVESESLVIDMEAGADGMLKCQSSPRPQP
jgi:hypothetical protein